MEIAFVIVCKKKKKSRHVDLAISSKTHFKLDFSQPFLTKTNGSFSQRENVWRNDGALVYACQWRPDPRRRDAHGATSFMNDELIWDVTRAVDS